jgi:hypothetical protein
MSNTREEWLNAALIYVREHIRLAGGNVPTNTRISCGFPVGSRTVIGQCWYAEASADGTHEIFVSPELDDALRILDVLIHEAIHAALPSGTGHKAPFKRIAEACGLTGKMTATVASDELKPLLRVWLEHLGAYPHAKLDPNQSGKKKQSTRLVKCQCDKCGYTVRTTAKWLEFSGAPFCPTGACNDEDTDMPNRMTATVTEEGEE